MTMTDTARDQAVAQMQYIERLLSAYRMDWDQYEYLLDNDQSEFEEDDLIELRELTEQAADCESEDEALERLENNPLSILYRSSWEHDPYDLSPSEFEILLCTGGPAVRIRGDLDNHGYPTHAWVEYSDWGTPWTELFAHQSTALEYAQLLLPLLREVLT